MYLTVPVWAALAVHEHVSGDVPVGLTTKLLPSYHWPELPAPGSLSAGGPYEAESSTGRSGAAEPRESAGVEEEGGGGDKLSGAPHCWPAAVFVVLPASVARAAPHVIPLCPPRVRRVCTSSSPSTPQ